MCTVSRAAGQMAEGRAWQKLQFLLGFLRRPFHQLVTGSQRAAGVQRELVKCELVRACVLVSACELVSACDEPVSACELVSACDELVSVLPQDHEQE